MADGVNIDWPLAQPKTDFAGSYANAFQMGRQIAGQNSTGNAMASYMANLTGPIGSQLGVATPELEVQLQSRQGDAANRVLSVRQAQAGASGDLQGAANVAAQRGATGDVTALKAKIDALPEEQRAAAAAQVQQTNEAFAHVLMGLRGYPPEQRLPMAQHIAQTSGLMDPSQITADDVTDAGINAHLATAMTVEQYVKTVQADAELGKKARHGQASEGATSAGLGVTQGQLGVAPSSLVLERQRAAARSKLTPATPTAVEAALGAPGAPRAQPGGAMAPGSVAGRPVVQALTDGSHIISRNAASARMRLAHLRTSVDPTAQRAAPPGHAAPTGAGHLTDAQIKHALGL
jgi:hypothetical protein